MVDLYNDEFHAPIYDKKKYLKDFCQTRSLKFRERMADIITLLHVSLPSRSYILVPRSLLCDSYSEALLTNFHLCSTRRQW